jgi:hypothetical protein
MTLVNAPRSDLPGEAGLSSNRLRVRSDRTELARTVARRTLLDARRYGVDGGELIARPVADVPPTPCGAS